MLGFGPSSKLTMERRDLTLPDRQRVRDQKFRPMLVAIWYPASAPSSSRMIYRDYLDVPRIAEFAEFALRLKRFGEKTARETAFRKKEEALTAEDRLAFDHLFTTETRAHRDATAAAGRFPVVVYHPGASGSFEENAVLFEFLASHGYVVISSAYQISTAEVSNNIGGPRDPSEICNSSCKPRASCRLSRSPRSPGLVSVWELNF